MGFKQNLRSRNFFFFKMFNFFFLIRLCFEMGSRWVDQTILKSTEIYLSLPKDYWDMRGFACLLFLMLVLLTFQRQWDNFYPSIPKQERLLISMSPLTQRQSLTLQTLSPTHCVYNHPPDPSSHSSQDMTYTGRVLKKNSGSSGLMWEPSPPATPFFL